MPGRGEPGTATAWPAGGIAKTSDAETVVAGGVEDGRGPWRASPDTRRRRWLYMAMVLDPSRALPSWRDGAAGLVIIDDACLFGAEISTDFADTALAT